MNSGERYCLLIDSDSDLPLFYPNLYVTTQIRNKSLSYSAMEATILREMAKVEYTKRTKVKQSSLNFE